MRMRSSEEPAMPPSPDSDVTDIKKNTLDTTKFAGGLVGSTAPLGEFDPASLSSGVWALGSGDPDLEVKRFRESELTHGRVAMLATLGWLFQEKFPLLFGGSEITMANGSPIPAIYHFEVINNLYPAFWYFPLGAIAIAELLRAGKGWEPLPKVFELKEDYDAGNLNFDPLGMLPEDAAGAKAMKEKELNNGRLAMIAVMGFMAQELVTKSPIF